MSRTMLIVAGVFSAPGLLLVDSAVKGTALLMLAAVAAITLRRDSAATRHFVWLLAIVALLVVPVLSAMLPQWRVLPEWAGIPHDAAVVPLVPNADGALEMAQTAGPDEVDTQSTPAYQPAAALPGVQPMLAAPEANPSAAFPRWNWLNALPLAWGMGFCVLILRLIAARWMLWNTERQGTVVWPSGQPAQANDDPIVTALESASSQLRMRRPVTLLIYPGRTIPVVWGILRCRLLLPAAARHWNSEQLRSVLLHELAHIKRRDTLAHLLAQFACALHWFNPLAWFAAWRLGLERERACDDLVLASGVRPSAYAEHLLGVVTQLVPAPWTQSCGLAMARKSSLEGRLVAVLSQHLNRRGVTTALAAVVLLLGVGIAVPLAMLRAAAPDKPDVDHTPVNAEPKDARSRPLFEHWKSTARTDGSIPGGRIGEMAESLKVFMDLNPGHEQTVTLEPVLKKCDASRDWTPAQAASLLDEIAAITSQAEWTMRSIIEREIHPGKPLPEELVTAPWGEPAENGLRMAWLLEPRAQTQALGSVMKSRVLFHNAGQAPVYFATVDWIQSGGHTAQDANGKDISVLATERLGIRLPMVFRLAPGEHAEVEGHSISVGPHDEAYCWIEPKLNDDVIFTPADVGVAFQTWQNDHPRHDSLTVWSELIAARVAQESPMPAAAADREQLLRRVTMDLLGAAPTREQIASFVNDDAPEALARLAARLQATLAPAHFAGELPSGTTRFHVTAAAPKKADPQQAAPLEPQTPEAKLDRATLQGVWTGAKDGISAEVKFLWHSEHQQVQWELKDKGGSTIGAQMSVVMEPDGSGAKFVFRKGAEFEATQGRLTPGAGGTLRLELIPNPNLTDPRGDVTPRVGRGYPAAKDIVLTRQPDSAAKLQPGTEQKLQWGEPVNGLRMALAWPPTLGEPAAGEVPDFFLAVQNVSQAPVRFCTTAEAPHERRLTFATSGVIQGVIVSSEPNGVDATLQPREVVFLRLFMESARETDRAPHGAMMASAVRQSPAMTLRADLEIAKAPAGAWTGKLVTPDTRAGVGAEAPANRKAQELFKVWLRHARVNGKIPGGLIARVGERVQEFVRANVADKAGAPYAQRMQPLLPRLDGTRDWQPADASALLNDIAAVSDAPLSVMLEEIAAGKVQHGLSLPKDLLNAPWGEPLSNGLRAAWLIGSGVTPRLHYVDWVGNVVTRGGGPPDKPGAGPAATAGTQIRLGTPLGCRILIHNAGKEPVVFRTRAWHHIEPTAKDAKGAEIGMESVTRYTRAPLMTFRLEPGRYIELPGPGFGLGRYGFHDFGQADIATWIGAKEGDEVTLLPGPAPLQDWNEPTALDGEPRWWLDFITARLALVTPLPGDAAERRALLDRAMADLFLQNVNPTDEEAAAFLSDTSPRALTNLAERIFHRPGVHAWAGPLQSGATRFRVLPADPKAPKPPERPAPAASPASSAPADKPPPPPPGEKTGADAKLPDDALWDTKAPFERIPVIITNWSAEKNGQRIGMRVVADEGWRIGSKVKVEMWLHNPGAKNISFNAIPGRSDVGLSVAAKDSAGEDHWAVNGNVDIIAIPTTCVLPAGHVAKVKDFTLSFDAPDNTELAWFGPKFRELVPGQYKLRCVWSDAHPSVSNAGDWTGELTTSDVDFTLAALE